VPYVFYYITVFFPVQSHFVKFIQILEKTADFWSRQFLFFRKRRALPGFHNTKKPGVFYKWLEKAPLRGTGKPPTRVSPTPEQSGGLFRLPFLRFFLCFRPWGAAPNPARF
jgi:hypothetical protein